MPQSDKQFSVDVWDENLRKSAAALRELIEALMFYETARRDARRAMKTPPLPKIYTMDEICALDPEEENFNALVEAPVSEAIRLAIRLVGKHVFRKTKSLDCMRAILEEASANQPAMKEQFALGVCDKLWNGIGDDENGRWWS